MELELVLSIDVEEEGLFRGRYERRRPSVDNVAHLSRLFPLSAEFGECSGSDLPLNLLCTYSVFADAGACRILDGLRGKCRVEIGAHLHHWNTPPIDPDDEKGAEYRSPARLSDALFRKRLDTLFSAGRAFCGEDLTSFRMGKWDLHRRFWPFLAEAGVLVDASVRPLHYTPGGPDHYLAPSDPYRVNIGGKMLLEVPLTCIPLFKALNGSRVFFMPPEAPPENADGARLCPFSLRARLAASVQKWGSLALLPAYHPLWAMKALTRMHAGRGGKVVSLTWHSSEMMPGATPHLPDEAAVEGFLRKMRAYLRWLARFASVRGRSFKELRKTCLSSPQKETGAGGGDWRWK
jgi:hypothetical protein